MRQTLRFCVLMAVCLAIAGLPAAAEAKDDADVNSRSSDHVVEQKQATNDDTPDPQSIIGGDDAAPGDYPFQVSLRRTGFARYSWDAEEWGPLAYYAPAPTNQIDGHQCGGTLVHPEWVLTAAHCVADADEYCSFNHGCNTVGFWEVELDGVIVGAHTLSATSTADVIKIVETHVHPDYYWQMANFQGFDVGWWFPQRELHDLALLRLAKPVDAITPIQLLDADAFAAPGNEAHIIGWGLKEGELDGPREQPDVLQHALVPIHDDNECRAIESDYHNGGTLDPATLPEIICVGITSDGGLSGLSLPGGPQGVGVNACYGDSGGPLFVDNGLGGYGQVGVMSYGVCSEFSAYTQLTNYIPWITDVISADHHPDPLMMSACSDSIPLIATTSSVSHFSLADAWDAGAQPHSWTMFSITANDGRLTRHGDLWRYTPPYPGFGADWFTYTATDESGDHTGRVNLNIMTCSSVGGSCVHHAVQGRATGSPSEAATKGPGSKADLQRRPTQQCLATPQNIAHQAILQQDMIDQTVVQLPAGWLAP